MTYEKPTIKQEMVNFLRNSDIISISDRGVVTYTDTGTFTGANSHTVSNNPTKIKNIRSITIDSTILKYGKDYSFNFETGVIYFVNSQTGSYSIIYDGGTSDKIYPDLPRQDLQLNAYPRIAVDILNQNEDVFGIGGNVFFAETLFTIYIYSESQDFIETKIELIKSKLRENAKNFYNCPFVKPIGRGPIIKSENRNQTLLQSNVDCLAMFEVIEG